MGLVKTLLCALLVLCNSGALAQCNWWLNKPSVTAAFAGLKLERLSPQDQTSYYPITSVTPLRALLADESAVSLTATAAVINEVLKPADVSRRQLRAALEYLLHLDLKTQLNLAVNFEAFAVEIMRRSQNDWQAFRYFGSDGSIAYAGIAGHGLAVTTDGDIYLGIIDRAQLQNDARWIPHYSRLKKITLENTP